MKKADEHFLKLFHNNLVGMILTDEQHIIVDVNSNILQLTEFAREEMIGKTTPETKIISETVVRDFWLEFEQNQILLNKEVSFVAKSGKTVYALFSTEKIELDGKIFRLTTLIDITESKKSEKALADIYERVTDGFVALDKNWNYTYINRNAALMMNSDAEYIRGKNVWAEFPHMVGTAVQQAYFEAMEKQVTINLEEYFEPQDMWYLHMIYPSPDALSVFFKDINYRKKDEARITDSELLFRTLIKTAPVGIFETDANGSTTFVNDTWLKYTGMKFDEALGDGWMDAVHPADKEWLLKGWYNKAETNDISSSEYRIIDKAGNQRWVSGKAVPVINGDGIISSYIGTITDITALKNALNALEKSEDVLHIAQQISKTGNWELYFATGQLYWSKEVYRIFDLDVLPQEKLNKAYRDRFHPEDLHLLDEGMKLIMKTGERYEMEHRIICSDGSIKYIFAISQTIEDENGTKIGIKGTVQDITVRKTAELELLETTRQLKELSTHLQQVREDERKNIALEIHDELGQQLTGIKMDIMWLKKKLAQGDDAITFKFDDTLKLVSETVSSIRRITTELRPSIIDDLGLNAALDWLVKEFNARMDIKVNYRNYFEDAGINSFTSINIFRILQESLTNIAKHANAKTVEIFISQHEKFIQLIIKDDGLGFNTNQKRINPAFGLMGIRERTDALKGNFTIHSSPGNGTEINVTIPLN